MIWHCKETIGCISFDSLACIIFWKEKPNCINLILKKQNRLFIFNVEATMFFASVVDNVSFVFLFHTPKNKFSSAPKEYM